MKDDPQPVGTILRDRIDEILTSRGIDPDATPAASTYAADPQDAKTALLEQAMAYTTGRIPARYRDASTDDQRIRDWAMAIIDAARIARGLPCTGLALGPSLLILGPTGVGKTHQAYGALRELAGFGIRCGWIAASAADLYANLRPRSGTESEDAFRKIATAELVFIDDLGAAKGSEWTEEITYRLINHRYEHMLPTIFTSNVAPGELKAHLGDRVASRLVEMCTRVVLKGEDRRRT